MPARRTLHLGHLAGVPIGVQPLWLAIVGLITFALGHDYFPARDPALGQTAAYALGLLSALLLFAGILLHELGHAVVARRSGMAVDEIDLWLLGGVARMHGEPRRPADELRFALAGPAVTAMLLACAAAVRLAFGGVMAPWARALVDYQVDVNAMILGFNLLPAFPLDGGRVARSLLWLRGGDHDRATARAAALGRAFGLTMVLLGFVAFAGGAPGGLWLALVGGFLVVAGAAEAQQAEVHHRLGGLTAGALMSAPAVSIAASATLEEAVADGFARHLFTAFPVIGHDGEALGILPIDAVRAVPAAERASTTAWSAAVRDPALLAEPGTPVVEILARPAFARVGRAVVVDPGGRPLGVLSITDLDRRLRSGALLPARGRPEPARA